MGASTGAAVGARGMARLLGFALLASLCASMLASAVLAARADAANRIYWVNRNLTTSNRVSYANLDGSGGGNLSTTGSSTGTPRGVSLDVVAGKIYWTVPDANRVSFTNLDGSAGAANLTTTGATVDHPNAVAVYPANNRIYWANEFGDRISFARLDNTGGGGNLTTTGATVDVPIGPAVNPETGRIYWPNANPVNKISYANIDGSGGADLNTSGATIDNPHGVGLDPVTSRVYWSNLGGNKISFANLNNSGGGDLNTGAATVNWPAGIAIDPVARKIYWANYQANKISWANLDGSGGGDLGTPGATLDGSMYVALLQAPLGTAAPGASGGSTAGTTLSCSQGSWAPDLLGSFLYRVPASFGYVWSRNGVDIPGANASSYSTNFSGDYRCRVTGTNPAGATAQTSTPKTLSPGSYPHPGSGTPLRVPMVPKYRECTSPDSTHVAPLALDACTNPVLESQLLTMSDIGKGAAFVGLTAQPGNLGTPADEADISVNGQATDVRDAGTGGDYTGQLLLRSTLRITDLGNGPDGVDTGTVQDLDFSLPVDCVASPNPALGSKCSVASTVDTLVPGFAKENKRTVLSTYSFDLTDMGADGTITPPSGSCPPTCGSGDERVYLSQGLFTP